MKKPAAAPQKKPARAPSAGKVPLPKLTWPTEQDVRRRNAELRDRSAPKERDSCSKDFAPVRKARRVLGGPQHSWPGSPYEYVCEVCQKREIVDIGDLDPVKFVHHCNSASCSCQPLGVRMQLVMSVPPGVVPFCRVVDRSPGKSP